MGSFELDTLDRQTIALSDREAHLAPDEGGPLHLQLHGGRHRREIFLLELVFRGGECSVASSRRLYKTPPAVPHHVARDKAQQKVDLRFTPS